MLKLYAVPISLYCAKLRIILRHKQLEWEELAPPGGYGSAEYKNIIPAGNLPALVHNDLVHDPLILGDSEAIAEYLNEAFPLPKMLPDEILTRAKVRERSRFHDTRLEPALRVLFGHIAKAKRDDEIVAKQWQALQERIDQFTSLIPAKTDALTLGDCGFAVSFTWIELLADHFNEPLKMDDALKSYLYAISKFDAVAAELADYKPRLVEWLSTQ